MHRKPVQIRTMTDAGYQMGTAAAIIVAILDRVRNYNNDKKGSHIDLRIRFAISNVIRGTHQVLGKLPEHANFKRCCIDIENRPWLTLTSFCSKEAEQVLNNRNKDSEVKEKASEAAKARKEKDLIREHVIPVDFLVIDIRNNIGNNRAVIKAVMKALLAPICLVTIAENKRINDSDKNGIPEDALIHPFLRYSNLNPPIEVIGIEKLANYNWQESIDKQLGELCRDASDLAQELLGEKA